MVLVLALAIGNDPVLQRLSTSSLLMSFRYYCGNVYHTTDTFYGIVAMIRKTVHVPYNGDNVAKYNLWKRIYKFHLRVRAQTVLYYTVLAVKI